MFHPVVLKRLTTRTDRQRALGHAGGAREGHVLVRREREVFVHLVADDDGVVARGELGDRRALRRGEDLAGRIVRRVEQDERGALAERRGEGVLVEREVGKT